MKKNALCSLLGIAKPIIQAPMAGVGTPSLAAEVSNAGGLGSLAVGAMSAQQARQKILETRTLTGKPFNVNVFCHKPARADEVTERAWLDWLAPVFARYGASPPSLLKEIYKSFVVDDEMLQVLEEEKPSVVSFHFGLPPKGHVEALHRAGIKLVATATSLKEAEQIARAGIDAVVAQGIEAGGHRGTFDSEAPDDFLSTFVLTRLIVTNFDLPVIAAGGIADGAGIVAALALGAQAAQLGTIFVPCKETDIDAGYRRAILSDSSKNTAFTSVISGRTARGIVNKFMELECSDMPKHPDYPIAYDAGKALHAAAKAKGEFGFGAQWAGQAVPLAREMCAAELMEKLENEMKITVRNMQNYA